MYINVKPPVLTIMLHVHVHVMHYMYIQSDLIKDNAISLYIVPNKGHIPVVTSYKGSTACTVKPAIVDTL